MPATEENDSTENLSTTYESFGDGHGQRALINENQDDELVPITMVGAAYSKQFPVNLAAY